MNYFYEGQKVICLNNKSRSGILPIEPGKIYTIISKYVCPCGSDQLVLQETFYRIIMNCKCAGPNSGTNLFMMKIQADHNLIKI